MTTPSKRGFNMKALSILVYEIVVGIGGGILGAICFMALAAGFLGTLWLMSVGLFAAISYPNISVPILAIILVITLLGRKYKNEN